MAISTDQLTVEVVLDSSGAVKGIKDLQGRFLEFDQVLKSASKSSEKANSVTENMGQLFDKVSQSVGKAAIPLLGIQSALSLLTQGFNAVSGAVGSFVDEFAQAERAQVLLNQSLQNAAPRILNTASAWSEYFDQLERSKNVDADVLKGLTAQAVQMGFSEQQIKSLIDATVGLSKVTGQELGASFQQLIGTTRGMARSLQVMFTDVANLTEEQLKSGAAFDVVAEKTKNAASAAGSFSASTKALGFVLGGVREDIGKIIVESLNLKGGADALTATFYSVRDAFASLNLNELGQKFSVLVEALRPIITVGAGIASVYGVILAASSPLVVTTTLLAAKFVAIAAAAVGAIALFEQIALNASLLKEALVIAANVIGMAFLKMFDLVVSGFQKLFSLFGDNALAKAADNVSKSIQRSMDNLSSNISGNFEKIKSSYDTGFSGEAIKQGINFVKAFNGEVNKTTDSLGKLGQTGARVKVVDEQALQKAASILKDVQNITERLRGETAGMNADEKRQIDLKLDAQMRVIDAREKELQALGKLNAAQRSALADARIAAAEQANAARQALANKNITQAQADALKQLESLQSSTVSLEQQNSLSKLEGLELIRAQYDIEQQKIDAIEKQLSLTGKLGEEQQAQLQRARAALGKGQDIAAGKNAEAQAQKTVDIYGGLINSAASGADSVVGNAINQLGKAFGPEGQIIAGAINLLRMGGEQMKNLGSELIKIIVELPLMIAEGIVGLVEGLLQGVINMLGDPARLAKIIIAFQTIVPKVITALAKAIPTLLKMLLDPKFWMELVSQIVRSLFDAFMGMIYSVGDMLASIFSGDVFDGMESATKDMGRTVDEGIRYATNALTGVSEQMFGVMEDTAKQNEKAAAGKGGAAESAKKKEASWFQKYIIQPLAKVVNFITEGLKGIGNYVWGVLEPAIGFLMNAIATPIKIAMELVEATFAIVGQALSATWNAMVAYMKGMFDVIVASFKAAWNVGVALFKGVIDFFKTVFDEVANVFRGIWQFAKSIFDVIVKTFQAMWDFVAGIFDDPIAAFQKLWDDLSGIVSDLWDSITELGTVLWDAIKSIGTAMFDAFKNVGSAIWEGLQSIGGKIWDMFKNVGSAIWEGTKNIGTKIGESLSNVGSYLWDGIKGAFENVKSFFKNLFSFDGGGRGAVEKFLGFDFPWLAFAEGGVVPGRATVIGDSSRNDTVPALLSPGEVVIPRSKVQDPANARLISAIMSGEEVGMHAKGLWGNIVAVAKGEKSVGEALGDAGESIVNTVKSAGKWLGDLFVPDWIQELWDSITKFVSNLELKKLVQNPWEAIKDAIGGAADFLIEPFKKMLGLHQSTDPSPQNTFESSQPNAMYASIAESIQQQLKISIPSQFAEGGFVPGVGNKDTVPAMLTPGEFVINKSAAQNLGSGLLNQLNAGVMPQSAAASQAPVFNINLNIETSEAIDDNYIRNRLIPTIKQEIRSSSLRGEFLVSSKGVR